MEFNKMDYYPDKWVVVKVSSDKGTHYRVFATWSGGYLQGDSWKLNSGIERVEVDGDTYNFIGASGSSYFCNKNSYGTTLYGQSVLTSLIADAEVQALMITVEWDQDFTEFDWSQND
jgi:hypothetical protein